MELNYENADQIGPNLPNLADLKKYLREEKPLYYQVLEEYLRRAAHLINELGAKLERSERQAHDEGKVGERQRENEEQLVLHLPEHQQCEEQEMIEPVPALVHDEVEGVEEDEATELRQVPHELFLNEEVIDAVPRAALVVRRRREVTRTREIVLRSRTVRVPIVEEIGHEVAPASPQAFHVPVVEGLPAHYQELLVEPEIDPYTVIRNGDGSVIIGCGICPKQFGTLKGWRIHAAKMHTQNGFCHKCGHFVKMPQVRSAEEVAAMMELHSLEWCPKATKAVIDDRAAKRRRLELVGRNDEAEHYYIPGR
ncbi:zinc finger protein [Loa loa]|uniref:Zinc finger protein n=1 Tax=Loa loa TaxID=7209 RepID=A0A1S0THR0_LOALO|nr:zinc finger protein [Loa loa]EFO14162.1 zinc finger protein [Loa loa]